MPTLVMTLKIVAPIGGLEIGCLAKAEGSDIDWRLVHKNSDSACVEQPREVGDTAFVVSAALRTWGDEWAGLKFTLEAPETPASTVYESGTPTASPTSFSEAPIE